MQNFLKQSNSTNSRTYFSKYLLTKYIGVSPTSVPYLNFFIWNIDIDAFEYGKRNVSQNFWLIKLYIKANFQWVLDLDGY